MGRGNAKQGRADDEFVADEPARANAEEHRAAADDDASPLSASCSHRSATSVMDGIFPEATGKGSDDPERAGPYVVLPRLSDYALGDPLRKRDKAICGCREATSYALRNLRPGDCAFVVRSNGTYTYAYYEGYNRGDPSLLSFKVDDRGHYKPVPARDPASYVKIPVLPHRAAAGAGGRSDQKSPPRTAPSPAALPGTGAAAGGRSPPVARSFAGRRKHCQDQQRQSTKKSKHEGPAPSPADLPGTSAAADRRSPPSAPRASPSVARSFAGRRASVPRAQPLSKSTTSKYEIAKQMEENFQLHRALSYISLKLEEDGGEC